MRTRSKIGSTIVTLLCVATTYATDIERASYKITIPDKSTVDPQDSDIDLDHMTTINLPNDNNIIILAIDDKALIDKSFTTMTEKYKNALKNVQETGSDMANLRNGKGVLLTGLFNGMKYCFEVGAFAGKKCGFIIVCAYPEKERVETREMAKKAVDSLKIKE